MSIDLRLGDWRTVLADVTCGAVICDPPYGGQTHEMSRAYSGGRADGCSLDNIGPTYKSWNADDVSEFVESFSPRCSGWMVALTSSDLIEAWQAAYRAHDRYSFAPVACVMRGMTVRLGGDGPSSWTVYAMVARPRTRDFSTWGTLDGAYTGPRGPEAGGGRGKPLWLMNALVRDYSKPGDLVCDPFAGWGTTAAATQANGRRFIGAEVDGDAYTEALRRLKRPQQIDMFGGAA